ncbi:MAG: hypothetical protein KC503_24830 [Myxococcales bacterium]|nr:hypothetical protein [Myxococcales bacterium]
MSERRGRIIRGSELPPPPVSRDVEADAGRPDANVAPLSRRRTRVLKQRDLQRRARAESMIDDAHVEADVIRERAEEDGAVLASRLVDEAREQAAAIAVKARAERAKLLEESEQQLTALGVAIAEKLLGRALGLSPQLVADVVAQCLREAGAARRVVVRVNPSDVAVVQHAAPRLAALADSEALLVEADASIAAGGCVVQTDAGEIDGRLESQLAVIERTLIEDAP